MKERKFANSKLEGGIINKRNAFTLIELLAIIVILAIIAVITVPIILNIIENSKEGASIASAYGYKDAINKYYLSKLSKDSKWDNLDGSYTIDNNGNLKKSETETYNINVSGQHPTEGYAIIQDKQISGCLVYDDYEVTINNGEVTNAKKGDCKFATQNDADTIGQLTIGDTVKIGDTEEFYVINSNSSKTVLLTHYNLNSLNEQAQSSTLSLAFSSSKYWCDENDCPLSKYKNDNQNNNYIYVYDSNSILYTYVNEYKTKLMESGPIINARLLSYEEASSLNSSILNNGQSSWLGTTPINIQQGSNTFFEGYQSVFFLNSGYGIQPVGYSTPAFGVRPVIEISTSAIQLKSE